MKKLTLLLFMILGITLSAQLPGYDTSIDKTRKEMKQLSKENIKLDLTIYVDNAIINEKEEFHIEVNCVTQNFTSNFVGSNKFILYLNYDNEYMISFTKKGCSTKKIYVNTRCPYDDWYIITQVKLQKKSDKNIMAGKIWYSDSLQTFKALVYK